MKNTENGSKVVREKLDECIAYHIQDYTLQLNFHRLDCSCSKSCDVIRDILDINHVAAKKVLFHPVLQAYVDLRWKRVSKYFLAHFFMYWVFLLNYSAYIGWIFWRNVLNDENTIRTTMTPELSSGTDVTLSALNVLKGDHNTGYLEDWISRPCTDDTWGAILACIAEIILCSSIFLQSIIQISHLISLGPRRYFHLENLLPTTVLILALTCVIIASTTTTENKKTQIYRLKWVSAFGILLAYLGNFRAICNLFSNSKEGNSFNLEH